MLATVRLNSEMEEILNSLTQRFHKKKSDVIREALRFYADELNKNQKTRMQKAMAKTAKSDFKEYKILEETVDDGL
ncbi:CopG family transcriptional regulator [Sulfurimonas sp. SAG-AH-194-C21]|nr:ribbon-helix-helix protein, CopG family [Sulfurimonas sp. SAG-AH-194-C21]MDF1883975.1 CopG family transcriptional regulator [Sulfurimonas sp. SAG-AH-194-C21]